MGNDYRGKRARARIVPPREPFTEAVYVLRWVNTRGEKGLWSEICNAPVAAWETRVRIASLR